VTDEEIKAAVLKALASVAPELDEGTLTPDESFRDQLDIDSMDFLNYVIALHEAFQVDIPEADQRFLDTIDGAIAYLRRKTAGGSAKPS
jgi:acyl carrier protein